jgi:hypothetical protein
MPFWRTSRLGSNSRSNAVANVAFGDIPAEARDVLGCIDDDSLGCVLLKVSTSATDGEVFPI